MISGLYLWGYDWILIINFYINNQLIIEICKNLLAENFSKQFNVLLEYVMFRIFREIFNWNQYNNKQLVTVPLTYWLTQLF